MPGAVTEESGSLDRLAVTSYIAQLHHIHLKAELIIKNVTFFQSSNIQLILKYFFFAIWCMKYLKIIFCVYIVCCHWGNGVFDRICLVYAVAKLV